MFIGSNFKWSKWHWYQFTLILSVPKLYCINASQIIGILIQHLPQGCRHLVNERVTWVICWDQTLFDPQKTRVLSWEQTVWLRIVPENQDRSNINETRPCSFVLSLSVACSAYYCWRWGLIASAPCGPHWLVWKYDGVVVRWMYAATSPHAPYNVTVSTSFSSAVVSWLPGYDGGHRLHYVLWSVRRQPTRTAPPDISFTRLSVQKPQI